MDVEEEVAALRETIRAHQVILRELLQTLLGIGRATGVWNEPQTLAARNALSVMLDRMCVGYGDTSPFALAIRSFIKEISQPGSAKNATDPHEGGLQ